MRQGRSQLRRNVFLPVALGLVLLTAIVTATVYWHQSHDLDEAISERLAIAARALDDQLEDDAAVLAALSHVVERDPSLQNAFLSGDRDALLKTALPIFQELRSEHRVTHFYFTDPRRVCFLRVHDPTRHGDVVTRFTTAEAATTGKPCHGLELGSLGTFSLRVVHPWKVGNRLLGYLELGEEIDRVLPRVENLVGVQLLVTIDKDYLDRAKWETGMRMLGRTASWNQFDRVVLVDSTMPCTSPSIDAILNSPRSNRDGRSYNAALDQTLYRVSVLPLADASGIDVGSLTVLVDVTKDTSALRKDLATIVAVTLAFFALISWLFWAYLGRQERSLAAATEELRLARGDAEHAADKLRRLSQAVEQSPAGILIADVQGSIEFSNSGFLRLTGFSADELVGNDIRTLQSDVYSPQLFARVQAIVLRGETWRGEIRIRKRSEESLWVNATFSPVLDKSHVVSHVVAMMIDATESRQLAESMREHAQHLAKASAEIQKKSEELAASELKYRTLFNSSRDAIMTLTPEEGFLDGNPAAARLFGCKDGAEFATFSPAELSPERQPDGGLSSVEAQEMMAIALRNGSHFFEWTHQRRDGRIFPATVLLTRMELEGRTLLQATVRDVSEERRLIESLRLARAEAATAKSPHGPLAH
jgi:PAS domain S-box-containing protein